MRVQVLCSVDVKVKEVQAAMLAAQQMSMSCTCPATLRGDTDAHMGYDVPSHAPALQITCDGARHLTLTQQPAEGGKTVWMHLNQAPFSIAPA